MLLTYGSAIERTFEKVKEDVIDEIGVVFATIEVIMVGAIDNVLSYHEMDKEGKKIRSVISKHMFEIVFTYVVPGVLSFGNYYFENCGKMFHLNLLFFGVA